MGCGMKSVNKLKRESEIQIRIYKSTAGIASLITLVLAVLELHILHLGHTMLVHALALVHHGSHGHHCQD